MNKVKTALNTAILFGVLIFLLHFAVQAESTVEQDIGELEYTSFCATCHGNDGKGNGPKANQLSAKPTNLT
ncbi:MAG: hypothetical protein KJO47_00695, partial [Gammaproteobacteria bacterium]|nr:hypothetical protein [Gammaproteobacteria bacterium]